VLKNKRSRVPAGRVQTNKQQVPQHDVRAHCSIVTLPVAAHHLVVAGRFPALCQT
jgi:hypothetical protein